MTSKLTREENVQAVFDLKAGYTLGLADVEILKRVARMAMAAMDSEPVAWRVGNRALVTKVVAEIYAAEIMADIIPLYRHAQSAPGVTFYRDGIEAAAKWIDQQREAYESEHGRHDPDTGSFEFGNDAQREYSSTLEELAEGIRALHPNVGNSPAIPDGYVMVPKEPTMEMLDEFDSIIDYGAEDSQDAWRRLLAAAPQEVKP